MSSPPSSTWKILIREFGGRPPRWVGLEHLPHEVCSARRRERLWGNLRAVYQALWGSCRQDNGARLFPRVHSRRRRRDNGQEGVRLRVGKKSFTMRTVEHWNRLPREAAQSPSWEVFKPQLDIVLSKPVWSHGWCDRIAEPGFGRLARPDGFLRSLPTGIVLSRIIFPRPVHPQENCCTKSHLLANADFFCLDIAATFHCLQWSVFIYEMLSPTA